MTASAIWVFEAVEERMTVSAAGLAFGVSRRYRLRRGWPVADLCSPGRSRRQFHVPRACRA